MKLRIYIIITGIMGALAVVFGAFGAHALQPILETHGRVGTYETAVSYHFYHVLAMMMVLLLRNHLRYSQLIFFCFLAGIVVFSGSLYILSLTGLRFLGAITPFGGVAFIIGWVSLAFGFRKS
jgi:uncharacterized membrane protein YgdD (TMEM256/DUF423 family)